jgi:low temperature requirement protein LtrA
VARVAPPAPVPAPLTEEPSSSEVAEEAERRTSYVELFFDLVFVFAITQVASLILSDTSAAGFARSLLLLALIWWVWSGYAWMTNAIDVDDRVTRLSVLIGMAGAFFMAFAVPGAYGDDGAWFGASYLSVFVLNLWLYVRGLRDDPVVRRSVLRLAPFFFVGPCLVLAGGLVDGNARWIIWVIAFTITMIGTIDAGQSEWHVSPSHFAERHALFLIIALGESIIAIGTGAIDAERDLALAGAMLVAFAGTAALWWAYFAWVVTAGERVLRKAESHRQRGRLARDIFTYFHLPMIAGIVLFAVAAKKAVGHGTDPLGPAGRFALGAGVGMFLLAFVAGRFRAIRLIAWERLLGAVAVALAAWLLDDLASAALIAVVVAIVAIALTVESIRLRELRAKVLAG